MTDTEINIAIAGACGWRKTKELRKCEGGYDAEIEFEFWHSPDGMSARTPWYPDYCHDLNAMHGVEKCVDADLAHGWRYWTTLAEILCADEQTETWQHYRVLIHATARQRAEAFLRVKGLWKEGA